MPIPALGPQNPYSTPLPTDPGATPDAAPAVPAVPAVPASGVAPSPLPSPAAAPAVATPSGGTASLNLDHLAKSIGLDPDEVLRRISNGEGLSSKLSAAGDTGYGSTVGRLIRGGIIVDEYA